MYADRNPGAYCITYVDPNTREVIHKIKAYYASVYFDEEKLEGRTSPVINFFHIAKGNRFISKACMMITLVHETAHTIGMPDVYNNTGHDQNASCVCVMEHFDTTELSITYCQDILNGSAQPFCLSCLAQMKTFTDEYLTGQRQIIGQS